jgi:hypothetical protein
MTRPRDIDPRPKANGRWQLWLKEDIWYAIEPDGEISGDIRQGDTSEESRTIAYRFILWKNGEATP